jgi:cobalt-zinc-cadmium efflux system protein
MSDHHHGHEQHEQHEQQHHHRHHHHHGGHGGRALPLAFALTLGFAGVEAIAGFWAGSLALLGDAGHMLTDAAALALAALAARLSTRPPSERHTFGLARVEVLAALVNAGFMLALVLGIAWHAVERLAVPREVQGGIVAWIAAAGLALNLFVAWILSRGARDLNTRGALLHVLGDALGSVAALGSGLVIHFTGWTRIDPISSLLICALILISTARLAREAVHTLLEGVPREVSLSRVGRRLAEVEGVHAVHDLHIWSISSTRTALSAHVVVADLAGWPALLLELQRMLHDEFDIDHATLQPELAGTVAVSRIDPAAIPIRRRG